jgi:phosphate transport system substrate-binding protein
MFTLLCRISNKTLLSSSIVGLIVTVLVTSGCGPAKQAGESNTTKTSISVKGSDTEVNLATELAEHFKKSHPDIKVAVSGGGSGVGIKALMNGEIDIANSSRQLNQEERGFFASRNVPVAEITFALDALAVVVNPAVGVETLTLAQLKDIYTGKVANWKEVGGADQEISLYGRQSSSGTFVFFRDVVLKAEYSGKMKQLTGTSQIAEEVKRDPAGIGYVGVGAVVSEEGKVAEGLKLLALKKTEGTAASLPVNREEVYNGNYPLVRGLYQFTRGNPEGIVRDFLASILAPEGQAIVKKSGYFPISD